MFVCIQLTVVLQPCETTAFCVLFDPAFRDDRYIRIASDTVIISYQEHAHTVSHTITLSADRHIFLWASQVGPKVFQEIFGYC